MNLEENIAAVETVSAALLAALKAADDQTCAVLVDRRREALTGLDAALANASPATSERFARRLRALIDADRDLNDAAGLALVAAGDASRAGFGLTGRATGVHDHEPQQACVDRRA